MFRSEKHKFGVVCFTDRKGKVMFSVHNRPHGYSFTARPCYVVGGTHPTGMLSCCMVLLRFHSYNLVWPSHSSLENLDGKGLTY